MKLQPLKWNAPTMLVAILAGALTCVSAVAQPQQLLPSNHAPENQKGFSTPQLAAEELIKAAEKYDVAELLEILGPKGKDFIASADPVRDKDVAQNFVAKAHEKNSVSVNKTKATLLVGNDHWPLPIPIVLKSGEWYFDTEAGRKEILFRRIGSNELDAIRICRGFVEAQEEYASTLHDGSTLHEYARKIISTPGKQDGLFWNNSDGSAGGPISLPVARAIEEGYSANSPSPYHGYFFKVLKGQGANAPLGRLDYEIHGTMIGGFALVAVPAEYRVTGVKTFMVNHYGIVYEKDLGPDSLKIVKDMDLFNPDKTWSQTNDGQ